MTLKTPPAGGSDELKFLAYGDMGKAPLDSSVEHYIQVLTHTRITLIIHHLISTNKLKLILYSQDLYQRSKLWVMKYHRAMWTLYSI